MLQSQSIAAENDTIVRVECRATMCRFNLCSQSERLDLLACNLKHVIISYDGECDSYESTKDASIPEGER